MAVPRVHGVRFYRSLRILADCRSDNGPQHQLQFRQDQIPHETLTVQKCLDTCAVRLSRFILSLSSHCAQKQGFTVAGLQNAQECCASA